MEVEEDLTPREEEDALASFRREWQLEIDSERESRRQKEMAEDAHNAKDQAHSAIMESTYSKKLEESDYNFSNRMRQGEEDVDFIDTTKKLPKTLRTYEPAKPISSDSQFVDVTHVSRLPEEVLLRVLLFLPPTCIAMTSEVCKGAFALERDLLQHVGMHTGNVEIFWQELALHVVVPVRKLCIAKQNKQPLFTQLIATRPRIRFNGIYASRNSYVRPGETEGFYNKPVHVVVFWRMIRLYPDGSCVYTMTFKRPEVVLSILHKRAQETEESAESNPHTGGNVFSGSYSFDDVTGKMNMWLNAGSRDLCFAFTMKTKQAGRKTTLVPSRYFGVKHGTEQVTDFPLQEVVPFRFYSVEPRRLL